VESINRQSILIVDDISANIEILNSILGCDYEVYFATSGENALEIALEQLPDLILLDVMMPEMDGYQVCKALKCNEKTRDIPVIFVTAKNEEEEESRGFDEGVVDYITKPVRPLIVRARVRVHLEVKRYRDYLKTQAAVDGLTGIANRRKFDEIIDIEWRRARRAQSNLSLIMMDIDHFKAYNDHYGHLAGDECLRRLARAISDICKRPADLFARYGGEEFVLLLPETDSKGAVMMANLVQEKIKLLRIPHSYSEESDQVTMSIGLATMIPGDDETPLNLIGSADNLLYAAKRSGRNQIMEKEMAA
jgi:diguanylate cyclase (GGDEF)-like protein